MVRSYLTVESLPSFRTTSYELIPHYQFTGLLKQDWDYINFVYVNHLPPFRSQANAVYTLGKSFTINHRVSYSIYIYIVGVDVVEWSRALDVRLSEWCCSVSMVWVQIPSREEHKFDSSKI